MWWCTFKKLLTHSLADCGCEHSGSYWVYWRTGSDQTWGTSGGRRTCYQTASGYRQRPGLALSLFSII